MLEIEQKPFPCVVFAKIKRIGTKDVGDIKEVPSYWYLNVQQGHGKMDKIVQFMRAGSKIVGWQNLDKDYRMNNGQMVRASNFKEIRDFVDAQTGKSQDPRLAELDVRPNPMAEKVANEQARRVRS